MKLGGMGNKHRKFSPELKIAVVLVIGLLQAIVAFGNISKKDHQPQFTFEKEPLDHESTISWDNLYRVYYAESTLSEIQQHNVWNELKGQSIIWTGKINAINQEDGLTVYIEMQSGRESSLVKLNLKDTERYHALNHHRGDVVTFIGTLNELHSPEEQALISVNKTMIIGGDYMASL